MNEKRKLSVLNIAAMFVGMIMGAGFSSGREIWQFFCIFGKSGYRGAIVAACGFVAFALMLTFIAIKKRSDDIGELISPFNSKTIQALIGYVIAAMYYTMIMSMSAAAGALLKQQIGISKCVGGAIVVTLAVCTVVGNYERMSAVFGKLVPVLILISFTTMILVLTSSEVTQSGQTDGFKTGANTSNWLISALLFMAYNTIGMISTAGACAQRAKNNRSAYLGALAGATTLGTMVLLMFFALNKDMAYSNSLDLPMLAYAGRFSSVLAIAFSIVLYGSIYTTATSTFYGFSTKLPSGVYKNYILIGAAIVGYVFGLTGYSFLVAYLYPLHGYLGFIFIVFIVINFIKEATKRHRINKINSL